MGIKVLHWGFTDPTLVGRETLLVLGGGESSLLHLLLYHLSRAGQGCLTAGAEDTVGRASLLLAGDQSPSSPLGLLGTTGGGRITPYYREARWEGPQSWLRRAGNEVVLQFLPS